MRKNVQSAAQLHLSHTLAKKYSKFSKPGFNSAWTMSFQMFKLVLEKAEESSRKKYELLFYWLCQKIWTLILLTVDHNNVWKILKEMGIPDHLACLLRNLYIGQEATLRTELQKTNCFQIGKGVCKSVHCHPVYLTYLQSTSRKMSS